MAAAAFDAAHHHPDADVRKQARALWLDLLVGTHASAPSSAERLRLLRAQDDAELVERIATQAAEPELRRAALVESVRGPGGGYRLGLAPGEISVGQVITAVDESVDATKCLGKGGCHGGTQCLTHSLWRDLSERISSFLGDITLAELVGQADVRRIAGKQDEQMKTVLSLVDRAERGDVSLKVQL